LLISRGTVPFSTIFYFAEVQLLPAVYFPRFKKDKEEIFTQGDKAAK
jgi:hypothetical protein